MYYNEPNKPILVLNERLFADALSKGEKNLSIVWDFNPYTINGYAFYPLKDNITNILNKNVISEVNDKAKLYFSKKSKIPRFKLQETEYKRVIKADKADYIIVNCIPDVDITTEKIVFTNDCAVFFVDVKIVNDYSGGDIKDFLKKLEEIHNRSNFDEEPVYVGRLNSLKKANSYIFDIYDKYIDKKIILDESMNRILDKKFSSMTEEDFKTIHSMLFSTDVSSVEMGLKLLSNMNVSDTPYLIYSLIYESMSKWKFNDAKNSVSIKNLFNSIGFKVFWSRNSIDLYSQIYKYVKDKFKKEPTEQEVRLIKRYFTNVKANEIVTKLNVTITDYDNIFFPKITITSE